MTRPSAIEIIAHRGFSAAAPENTVAALEAAVAAGADAVEFDMHAAACGTPVLFHDAMLSRTTDGVGPVSRRTFSQLSALDAGSWFSPDFAGERIPSLAQALAPLRGRTGRVYAEVKGFRELEDLDRMVRVTRDQEMLADTIFISMNWTALDRMRGQDEALALGYIVDEPGEVDEALTRSEGDPRALLDFKASILLDDPDIVERARAQSTDLAVWTVDDPTEADRLHALGVRRITTNRVEDLLRWKERVGS